MKRFIFAAMAIAFTLIGCSKGPRLTLMVGGAANELAYLETVLSNFTVETGIEVSLIRQSSETEQRKQGVLMSLRGQMNDPDVMFMDVGWLAQIAAPGWLEPLDNYEAIDSSQFFSGIVNQIDVYNGELIALPVYVDGGLLYYRTDLLQEYGYAGPPETWNELVEMSQTVQAGEREENPDFWGFVWQGAQYEGMVCSALEMFVSHGGAFFDSEGNPTLTDAKNEEALSFMVDLVHTYEISPPNTYTTMKEEEVRGEFQNGNALFERNWPYAYGLHIGEDSIIQDDVAIVPMPHAEGENSASTLGGWHAGVSVFSDMKEEAVMLLEYLTSYDVQKDFALTLGWNPGRVGVYNDQQVMMEMPHLVAFKEVFENAVPRPPVPYWAEMSTVLQQNLNSVLAGSATAAEMLEDSQTEILEVIEEYESE